jgi:hypothetical protein
MIEVLLDQGLAPRAAVLLVERGMNAVHVSEIGLAEAQDAEILQNGEGFGPGLRHARSRFSHSSCGRWTR